MSAFSDLDSIVPQRIWTGVSGRAVHGERITLGLIELEPGATVPEHSHENEQIGFLIEGSLRFRIGSENKDLEPGGTWCITAHVAHEVVAGPEGALLLEVFSPPRFDWLALAMLEPGPSRWP